MFKKNIILVLALLSFLPFVFSATEVINSCPGTSPLNNNTEYILSDNFVINQNYCFNLDNQDLQNVTFNGNFTPLINDFEYFFLFEDGKYNDITIENFDVEGEGTNPQNYFSLFCSHSNTTDFYMKNNTIKNHQSFISIGSNRHQTSRICGGSGKGNITTEGDFSVENTYVESREGFLVIANTETSLSDGYHDFDNLILKNIDYKNFVPTGAVSVVRGSFINYNINTGRLRVYGDFHLENINSGSPKYVISPFNDGFYLYGSVTYENVLDGSLDPGSDVLLPFGESDEAVIRESTNGVVYSNAKEPTMQECQSGLCPHDNMVWISQAWQSPSAYDSNKWYFQTQPLILNATFYHNFLHTVGVTLDLSSLKSSGDIPYGLNLQNTRTLRFDTSSTLYGGDDTSSKPIIITSGTGLDTSYTGSYYGTNYQLIEFQNDLTIDNINFDMNVAQDYGIVRKIDSGDDGLFQMYDSIVDINHNIDEEDMPQFVVGAMMDLQDNVFEIGQQYNITMFAGGISAGAGGGHKVINNEFQGGGFIFNHLQDGVVLNLPSKFIHNEFTQDGAFYGLPFDTQFGDYALLEDPSLNGTMIYETACTNYLFNIGNYYEDLDDVYTFNDTDLDGIADEEYYRGRDINGDNITDPRVIINYPYTFTNYLGKAYDTFDTCGDFAFDVEEPKDEIIYNETHDVISKWSYESTVYSDLICIESLNGHANIINNVDSDEVIVTDWDTSNGAFNYDLKCCDTVSCDNFVKAIDTIFFCVDNCNVPGEILDITTPAVYGCTDPEASNYDPTATIDDGSCEYDEPDEDDGGGSVDTGSVSGSINTDNLFSGDLDLTLDSLLNMFKLLNTPIIFLIFIGFIIVIIALFILIWSLFGLLMPGGK